MKFKELQKKFSQSFKKTSTKAWAIALAFVIILAVGFVSYAAAYSRIFPHVWVDGIALGGKTPKDALKIIEENFPISSEDRSITIKCENAHEDIMLSELNAQISPSETVETAFALGRQGGIFSKTAALVKSFFVRYDIPVSVSVDEEAFMAVINRVSAPYTTEVKNAQYSLDGTTLIISKGRAGIAVDKQKALGILYNAISDSSVSEITLNPEPVEPTPVDTDKFYESLQVSPRDAYYKYENGEVIVVDEIPKIIVPKNKIEAAFKSEENPVRIPVTVEMPEKTAAQLRSMLFRDTLATYSSSFASSSAARAENVTLSASRVNGYILMPGDVFSYDTAIGSRTVANGYRSAGVYVGNKVESGIGGGICQTSSTLYSAALYANLEIVSRTSHSLPVSYVPAGMDATIAEGYIDLKIRNNTEYPVKLLATVNGRKLTCSVLGVKTLDQTIEVINTRTGTLSPITEKTLNPDIPIGYKKTISKGADGYTVSSKRIVKKNGETIKTEKLTNSVYKAASIEVEINPADKDTAVESLVEYNENKPPTHLEDVPASSPSIAPSEPDNPKPETPPANPDTPNEPETPPSITDTPPVINLDTPPADGE